MSHTTSPLLIRVVLIDDHAEIRRIFSRLLKNTPQIDVVGEAVDGLEAQGVILEHMPDIVITDVNMPNMNGIDLVKWLSNRLPNIKTILLTAETNEVDMQAAKEAGAQCYSLKNIKPQAFIECILNVYQKGNRNIIK